MSTSSIYTMDLPVLHANPFLHGNGQGSEMDSVLAYGHCGWPTASVLTGQCAAWREGASDGVLAYSSQPVCWQASVLHDERGPAMACLPIAVSQCAAWREGASDGVLAYSSFWQSFLYSHSLLLNFVLTLARNLRLHLFGINRKLMCYFMILIKLCWVQ